MSLPTGDPQGMNEQFERVSSAFKDMCKLAAVREFNSIEASSTSFFKSVLMRSVMAHHLAKQSQPEHALLRVVRAEHAVV